MIIAFVDKMATTVFIDSMLCYIQNVLFYNTTVWADNKKKLKSSLSFQLNDGLSLKDCNHSPITSLTLCSNLYIVHPFLQYHTSMWMFVVAFLFGKNAMFLFSLWLTPLNTEIPWWKQMVSCRNDDKCTNASAGSSNNSKQTTNGT